MRKQKETVNFHFSLHSSILPILLSSLSAPYLLISVFPSPGNTATLDHSVALSQSVNLELCETPTFDLASKNVFSSDLDGRDSEDTQEKRL